MVPFARRWGSGPLHAFCLAAGGLAFSRLPHVTDKSMLFHPGNRHRARLGPIMGNPYTILSNSIPPRRTGVYMGIFNMMIVIPMLLFAFVMSQLNLGLVKFGLGLYDGLLGHDPRNVLTVSGICMFIAAPQCCGCEKAAPVCPAGTCTPDDADACLPAQRPGQPGAGMPCRWPAALAAPWRAGRCRGLPRWRIARTAASFSLDVDVPLSTAAGCRAGLVWAGRIVAAARWRGLVPAFGQVRVTATGRPSGSPHRCATGRGVAAAIARSRPAARSGSRRAGQSPAPSRCVRLAGQRAAAAGRQSQRLISWRGRHNAELVELARGDAAAGLAARRAARDFRSWRPAGRGRLGEGAGYHTGLVHALQLAWSGDSRIAVERDDEGFWLLSAGAIPAARRNRFASRGESCRAPRQSLRSPPEAATARWRSSMPRCASASTGPAARCARARSTSIRGKPAISITTRAGSSASPQSAAAIGVERFVLDDGWFRGRNDDTPGWATGPADPVKYPQRAEAAGPAVNALGMEFGLWVEPEMVNPDSDLYRAHPDWALALPGRSRPTARNQLVLDLRRPDVRDYLFGALDALLRELPIAYLKWDHNRDLAPAGGRRRCWELTTCSPGCARRIPWSRSKAARAAAGGSDAGIAAIHPPVLDQRQYRRGQPGSDPARVPGLSAARSDGRACRGEPGPRHRAQPDRWPSARRWPCRGTLGSNSIRAS